MIQVTLDEEIVEEFKDKVFKFDEDKFVPGATIFSIVEVWSYSEVAVRDSVFRGGPGWMNQYDDEFTEWLKEHRPEVFL